MSDEKALLAAIWEHPHEDTLRLVYADWLQEHGQPERAEFIRVQIEAAHLTQWDPRYHELDERDRSLWNLHWKTWTSQMPERCRAGSHRGFLFGRIQASGSRLAQTHPSLLALAPLWRLSSTQLARGWTKAVASVNFARIAEINASFVSLPGSRIQRMADSANARNLSRLQLRYCRLSDLAGVAIATSPHLRHLDKLGFGANELTDETATALPKALFAPTLRELQLGGNQLGPEGIRAIASGPFRSLVELDLAGCDFGDAGIRELIAGPGFPSLRYLRLRSVGMSDSSFAELLNWPGLGNVQSLEVSRNQITPASLPLLLASPHLTGVRRCQIDLSETPLETDPRIRAELREQFYHVVFDPSIRG